MRNANVKCLNTAFFKAKDLLIISKKKIKMEKQNQKFQELVKKMETLKENAKGQIKGGFSKSTSLTKSRDIHKYL
ncbi:hypothetical protein IMZ16_07790 [Cruoricaptor ignavus]|uniref:Uncharacterized protein n=1 Tax=Cruoricaptor ignavus TaxID=1118202 RepID=A0A7M1T2E0_9FLAO|nr:hypothetical protein [Cruoricaptor ignavus]QOR73427.1 hypothetical protein IMZ16_07790 [Cruoricaptor ignavus]